MIGIQLLRGVSLSLQIATRVSRNYLFSTMTSVHQAPHDQGEDDAGAVSDSSSASSNGSVAVNIFDPLACLHRNSASENSFVVISHDNKELLHQSIFDLWSNACYRATTSTGVSFCEKAIKHHKMIKERSVVTEAAEKEVHVTGGDVSSMNDAPLPSIVVTPPNVKISGRFQDRVIYSHPAIAKTAESGFEELKICMESTIVDLKHKAISGVSAIVILSDKRQSAHDFGLYADFISSSRVVGLCEGIPLYLFCCESCVVYLPAGESLIATKSSPTDWCSLVPLTGAATVTTSGLKWNLKNKLMSYGALISTSNELDRERNVEIKSDKPLIWSMDFKY